MSAPIIQGWCPGAHRPMMSGDGLVVRVRPRLARLNAAQALGLCELAGHFGNDTIDLTNRANLQLRGIAEQDHQPLLEKLAALNLLDMELGIEERRNMLVSPLYRTGDLTALLTQELIDRLAELPPLPAKFGFAIDTGPAPLLAGDSADIRLETDPAGPDPARGWGQNRSARDQSKRYRPTDRTGRMVCRNLHARNPPYGTCRGNQRPAAKMARQRNRRRSSYTASARHL